MAFVACPNTRRRSAIGAGFFRRIQAALKRPKAMNVNGAIKRAWRRPTRGTRKPMAMVAPAAPNAPVTPEIPTSVPHLPENIPPPTAMMFGSFMVFQVFLPALRKRQQPGRVTAAFPQGKAVSGEISVAEKARHDKLCFVVR